MFRNYIIAGMLNNLLNVYNGNLMQYFFIAEKFVFYLTNFFSMMNDTVTGISELF